MSFLYVKYLSINLLFFFEKNKLFHCIIVLVISMYSVVNNEHTIIIKNSKFISCLYYVESVDDVLKYLDDIKKIYPNATHYCYAYIIDNVQRESDDGEPAGTAGIPILQVLEKNHLNYVLCIVVRYFGKIKLGAGGLVRAYTKSVSLCLEDHIVPLKKGYKILLTFPYSYIKQVDYVLNQSTTIIEKKFLDDVVYQLIVDDNLLQLLKKIDDSIHIEILKIGLFIF